MATTTLLPLDPALSPQRVTRILAISADLLPDEVVVGRKARRSRTVVLAVVGLVVVLLGVWYARALHDVSTHEAELSAATKIATDLGVSEAAVRARTNRLVERGILQVVGVTAPKGYSPTGADQDDQIFIPLSTLQHKLVGDERVLLLVAAARPDSVAEVCLISMRGNWPSWTAWLVIENTPEITA